MQDTGRQFHIHCVEGDVGRYVFLPGDPGRCESIAALLADSKALAAMRERLAADFTHRSAEEMLGYVARDVMLAEATPPKDYAGL